MDSLLKEVDTRFQIVMADEHEDENQKVFTVRLPISMIEDLENIGSVLYMKRTEVARMILSHGVNEIKSKYKMEVSERHGASFEDVYDLETGAKTIEELQQKWSKEKEGDE